ncbi:argininosuccinate synthase, partial [Patescibacteria group bacterium]|nr:argininosuccinate synthase [Patescibacteria group bacterium]
MEILNRKNLKDKWVAGLFSGGLDSTVIVHWLSQAGINVLSITVDLGQPDEQNIKDIPRRMRNAGAQEAILVNGKEILARYMLQVIQGQACHEGGYWNTTGIARAATVVASLPAIQKRGIKFLTHGATGRGNDQVRFELVPAMLSPEIRVYAPWRDKEFIAELGGRKEMIEYCQKHKLKISATLEKPYSTDANFCGLTHEAGVLEYLDTPTNRVEFLMGMPPEKASKKAEQVEISFKNGRPVLGKKSLVNLFLEANAIAGRHGIGIGVDVVENRRVGIKSRGVYEAPGVTLLAAAYEKLLQLILDRNRRKFFDIVSRQLADAVYEGEWFSPHTGDLLAVVQNIAKNITG